MPATRQKVVTGVELMMMNYKGNGGKLLQEETKQRFVMSLAALLAIVVGPASSVLVSDVINCTIGKTVGDCLCSP